MEQHLRQALSDSGRFLRGEQHASLQPASSKAGQETRLQLRGLFLGKEKCVRFRHASGRGSVHGYAHRSCIFSPDRNQEIIIVSRCRRDGAGMGTFAGGFRALHRRTPCCSVEPKNGRRATRRGPTRNSPLHSSANEEPLPPTRTTALIGRISVQPAPSLSPPLPAGSLVLRSIREKPAAASKPGQSPR